MLIGRKEELKTLHQALIADESKFVAIYGRRRVGKTFLVREAFNNDFAFYHTGLANETNRIQLAEFNRSLTSYSKQKQSKLKDWYDAFDRLRQLLAQSTIPKKVVFIDEMHGWILHAPISFRLWNISGMDGLPPARIFSSSFAAVLPHGLSIR